MFQQAQQTVLWHRSYSSVFKMHVSNEGIFCTHQQLAAKVAQHADRWAQMPSKTGVKSSKAMSTHRPGCDPSWQICIAVLLHEGFLQPSHGKQKFQLPVRHIMLNRTASTNTPDSCPNRPKIPVFQPPTPRARLDHKRLDLLSGLGRSSSKSLAKHSPDLRTCALPS